MIRVYIGDIGTIDCAAAERLFLCLGAERKERVTRYKREKDRLLGIGAGVLLSLALSEELKSVRNEDFLTNTRPDAGTEILLTEVGFASLDTAGFPSSEDLETGSGAHGKPYLKRYPDFHYNISHSGTKVMLVCSDAEIGCDIEKNGPVRERIVRKAFAQAEQKYVFAADGAERDARFTEVWARKESFLKAAGTGIEREMDTFSVIGKNGKPAATVTAEEGVFEILSPAEVNGYACFICVKGG